MMDDIRQWTCTSLITYGRGPGALHRLNAGTLIVLVIFAITWTTTLLDGSLCLNARLYMRYPMRQTTHHIMTSGA